MRSSVSCRCCAGSASARNDKSATATSGRPAAFRAGRGRDRIRERALVGVAGVGYAHVQHDVGGPGEPVTSTATAGADQFGNRGRDGRVLDRIGERAAAGARINDMHARQHLRLARERGGDQRHREFVGAGFDRRARRRQPTRRERAQDGEIAQVQSDRAGIVLTEHDAIEPTLGRGAQREEVDVTVTGAHRKVVVEHTAELRAQRFRTRAVRLRAAVDPASWHTLAVPARGRRRTGMRPQDLAPVRRSG